MACILDIVGREFQPTSITLYLNSQNSDPLARMFAWISQNSAAAAVPKLYVYTDTARRSWRIGHKPGENPRIHRARHSGFEQAL